MAKATKAKAVERHPDLVKLDDLQAKEAGAATFVALRAGSFLRGLATLNDLRVAVDEYEALAKERSAWVQELGRRS